MKKKRFAMAVVCAVMTIALAGCSMLSSKLNDITGKLVGNSYTITTYDNYGNRVMTTTGDKINVQGNAVETSSYDSDGNVITGYELSSVITITIDGKEIESCGDTCIFTQDALKADVDFTQEDFSAVRGMALDAVFVNPLMSHSEEGKALFAAGVLQTKTKIVYHIPFAGEDKMMIRKIVEQEMRAGRQENALFFMEEGQTCLI